MGEFSDSATSKKLYGGYRFAEYFGFEASYAQTDAVKESETGFVTGIGVVTATLGAEFDAISLRGVGFAPFSWGSLFGGVGYFDGEGNAFLSASSGNLSYREETTTSEDGVTLNAGLQWEWESVDLRIEYEWWDIEDADASALGLGLQFKF